MRTVQNFLNENLKSWSTTCTWSTTYYVRAFKTIGRHFIIQINVLLRLIIRICHRHRTLPYRTLLFCTVLCRTLPYRTEP